MAESEADEATVASRRKTSDDTVVSRRRADVDDSTVASRKPAEDADKTLASRRKEVGVDDTVVVAGPLDDRTAVSNTVASLTQRPDRTRKVSRRTPRVTSGPPPGTPGILADGRVASKPGRHVERYPVRVAEPPPSALVRHTELAPIVEARRNLDPAAIAEGTAQARVNQAIGTVIAMVVVTTVAAAGVVAAIAILSQR